MAIPPTLVPGDPNAVSQAGLDLGLGADLQQQVMDEIQKRRKLALLGANQQPAAFGALSLGPNVTGAGNTGGMALQALMGTGVMGG